MASTTDRNSDRFPNTSRRQHGAVLSNDPVYLLGLLDNIDSDDSDDEFDGYIDLDDSMQSTTTSQYNTYTTHTMDDDETTENFTQTTMDTVDTTALSTGDADTGDLQSTWNPISQHLPVPLPSSSTVQEAASSEQTISGNSNHHQLSSCTIPTAVNDPPLQQPIPTAVAATAVNSPLISTAASSSQRTQLPDFAENPGVVPNMSGKQPGDFFDIIFSDDIVENICQETNRYAEQYIQSKAEHLQQHPHSRCTAYQGKPIEVREIKATFAMIIIMGIISLPSLPLYWSSK